MVKYTECAPARLTIGASRLLVLWTVRISPLLRSSFVEDIAIWLLGGGVALALLTSTPPAEGDSDRLDIFSGSQVKTSVLSGKRRSSSTSMSRCKPKLRIGLWAIHSDIWHRIDIFKNLEALCLLSWAIGLAKDSTAYSKGLPKKFRISGI